MSELLGTGSATRAADAARVGEVPRCSDAAAERLYYIAIVLRCHVLGTSAVDPLSSGATRSASDEEQGLTSCGPLAPADSTATVAVVAVYPVQQCSTEYYLVVELSFSDRDPLR